MEMSIVSRDSSFRFQTRPDLHVPNRKSDAGIQAAHFRDNSELISVSFLSEKQKRGLLYAVVAPPALPGPNVHGSFAMEVLRLQWIDMNWQPRAQTMGSGIGI